MVSLFFFLPPNQGEEDPFYREKETSLSCKFPMWDCLPQRKKKLKPQNVGPTPLSLVIFQCGIVSHKRKKILSLKIWGLQICPSSIEFMSVTNMNNEVKQKCEK